MALPMYTPNACNLSAPPGLNSFDNMVPAKVDLSSLRLPSPVDYTGANDAAQFSTGEWASKVHSVAPFLNTKGLQRALAILDQAIFNVQRVKAMEDMLAKQQADGDIGYDSQYVAMSCRMGQVQVYAEQQQLLSELQQLPFDPSSVRKEIGHAQAPPHLQPRSIPNASAQPFVAQPALAKNVVSESPKAAQKASERAKNALVASNARRVQTLSTSLQLLSNEDPDCLFIVRRINKLGFKAVRTLKRHFSSQGPVAKVLLAHSTVRQHGDPTCHARRRPSSLGFVQMGSAEAVSKVLALGAEQEVDGVLIRVQCFERQRITECEKEENEAEETELHGGCKFERGLSEASTAAPAHAEKASASESDGE